MKKLSFLCAISVLIGSFLYSEDLSAKKIRRNKAARPGVSEKIRHESNDPSKEDFVSADYALLMDFDTGDILFSKRSEERFLPASMTKLMTVYVVFCALREGKIKLTDEFPVSAKAQSMEGSRSFFKAGTYAKVEDLIKSIIVHSGNDACIIMAEGLYGDEFALTEEMNQKAKELGLKDTHFCNVHGLPDENHYSSAHDLAVIAKHLIIDFPEYYHYFSEKSFKVNGITQQNRNVMLGNSLGVDGLKTGHTKASGYGIVVSAIKNGKRLISVVNGCETMKDRALDSNKLLAAGFRQFSSLKIAQAGQPITEAKVWLGAKESVNLCTHRDIIIQVPEKYKKLVSVEAKIIEPIEAPVSKGAKLGTLTYKFGNFESEKYDLFACETVERLGMFDRAVFSINKLVFGSSSDSEVKNQNEKNNARQSSQPSPFAWRKTDSENSESEKNTKRISLHSASDNLGERQ